MVATNPKWIHDDSMDQEYVDYWDHASFKVRAKLLDDAGHDQFQKHNPWAVVPKAIRIDVVTIIKRNKAAAELAAAPQPRTTPNPQHWYNKESA